jgi:hypothetical protein
VTDDEARLKLMSLLPFASTADVAGFVAASDQEKADILAAFTTSLPDAKSALKQALDFCHAHDSYLSWLGPIGVAIQGALDLGEMLT